MDNIRDGNLKKLGRYIADALIDHALQTTEDDWIESNIRDYTIGELARCVTLQNLYLDREEFEKCAVMKIKIKDLTERLNIRDNFNPTELEDEDDNEE